MKKNNGVTLISLVVTIIVLMIIASVGTYSGIEALRNAKEESYITELNMLKQVVVENYTKYLRIKDFPEGENSGDKYIVGTQLAYADVKDIVTNINSNKASGQGIVRLKMSDYDSLASSSEDITIYYYQLSAEDLQKIGVSQVESNMYVVNYKTGEVINKEELVTRSGIPLYTYADDVTDDEPIKITVTPDHQDVEVENLSVSIEIQSLYTIEELKYTTTKILKEPDKSEFVNNVSGDGQLELTGVGNIYLWIYAKDNKGNELITSSGGYIINN